MSQEEARIPSRRERSATWSGCLNAAVRFVYSAGCEMFWQSIAKSASKLSSTELLCCVVGVWSIEMGDVISVGKNVVVMVGRLAGRGADGGRTGAAKDR